MYSAPFHISARRIKDEESPPAFYVHSKGDKAGLPSDTPVPSGYVVYLDEAQLIPQYFKYVLMYLNQSGAFKRYEKGAVIPFVRVEDMTDVIYDFFRKQAQSRPVKEAKEKLVGGKGDNKPDSAFNSKQLKIGIKDETGEHTPSKQIGKEIAKDHLASDPDYYKKLKAAGIKQEELEEKWSAKYKRSIDCNNPKGFSQRAHCQGKKKMNETIDEGKNKPTNPSLWSRAKSAARSKFKVYPSAYANAWASKWYKKHGGGWRKSKAKNESIELDIIEEVLLTECSCGCNECEVPHSYSLDIMDGSSPYVDEEFDEYEANTEDFINQSKGNPDLNGDGMYDEEELYYHFDLNNDSEVTPDEYESHIEFHTNNPEILNKHIKKIRPVVAHMIEEIWDK